VAGSDDKDGGDTLPQSDDGNNGEAADVGAPVVDGSDDSACQSSDVTWGASDFEADSDIWAIDFHSDATMPDDAEPFYDFER